MTKNDLPADVAASDLKYPEWKPNKPSDRVVETLTFYLVATRRGTTEWVLCTLPISKGRGGYADRSYAVSLNGDTCRVGRGPHVKKEVAVIVTESRKQRLQKYLDLKLTGLERAGQIRDRISSRRAEGQEMRAQGRSSWMWSR